MFFFKKGVIFTSKVRVGWYMKCSKYKTFAHFHKNQLVCSCATKKKWEIKKSNQNLQAS